MNTLLIVGLGNIGDKYRQTRHNVGFMFLDFIKKEYNLEDYKEASKFKAQISINNFPDSHSLPNFIGMNNEPTRIILVKPNTYMNNSGESVRSIKDYYEIPLENIIIIHDDLDIQFGEFKIQSNKGPRAHNGIISVERDLGTNEFKRIRIGIENRDQQVKQKFRGIDYVLSKFTQEEITELEEKIFKCINQKQT